MLKVKTDLRLKSKLVLRCEMHPRYNPEKDGAGGVRAACTTCTSILGAYQARQNLMKAAKEYEIKSASFEAKPKQRVDEQ